jgi:flagellum-specific peptidoglycan hydrolase FlgJ
MTSPPFPTPDHIDYAQFSANTVFAATGFYRWPSVALAQAKLESAGWTRLSGRNNGLGIKDFRPGHGTSRTTHETINGQDLVVSQPFADFESVEACYDSHAWLFWNAKNHDGTKIYADALHAPDAESFTRAMAKHYATSPVYATTLISIMRQGGYYRYDQPHGPPTTPPPSLLSRVLSWLLRKAPA